MENMLNIKPIRMKFDNQIIKEKLCLNTIEIQEDLRIKL